MQVYFASTFNTPASYYSTALKFRTYADHVTLNVSQTFKVNGSKVKDTA